MRHNIHSPNKLRIIGIIATLLIVTLLSLVTILWLRIESQKVTISQLEQRIYELENSYEQEEDAIRNMCLSELFDRLDNLNTTKQ